ncbi:kelch-like ECH-associated protein 1A [Polypterus senegalus]|uniref:kelch-like ECH-associated protein 1A n=1 Tax=Polypterus senegalus TaxID=55291 RepID=UPI00196474C5|nr:kelch-like ECH-associated protein 1A [Polypterus senegalus]
MLGIEVPHRPDFQLSLYLSSYSSQVHKMVLASCSPYFRAMFTSDFKECQASEVTIKDMCPKVMQRLIDFAYTSRVTVGESCVLHLLFAAMRFQMDDVSKVCCDFLSKNLEPANVIGITTFAESIGCTELHLMCQEYINAHFTEVTKEEEFFRLSHCQLLELVSQDRLKVLCESEVYKACLEWVRWDPENRAQYFHALLNAVHIHSLPPKFLKTQLLECPILSRANSCRDYLSKIFHEMALRKPCPPPRPRGNQLIYVAGGYMQFSLSSMQAFSPQTESWIKLADMPSPRSGLGGCVLFGLFYAVGGRNNSQLENTDSNTMECYNPMTNQWMQRAPMSVPRNRVGVGVIDGSIYAVGGSQGMVHHCSVERYDPEMNQWTMVAPMSVARIGAGVTTYDGHLYVVGGFDGENRWNSVERYHPDTDKWETITPMRSIRSGAGLVHLDGYIYAIGGYNGMEQLNSVERYSVCSNSWTPVAPMKHRRSALGVTVYQGKIYAFGGFNQSGFLSTVERYSPEKDEWTDVTSMLSPCSGMGVAVTMEPCPGSLEQEARDDEEDGNYG